MPKIRPYEKFALILHRDMVYYMGVRARLRKKRLKFAIIGPALRRMLDLAAGAHGPGRKD